MSQSDNMDHCVWPEKHNTGTGKYDNKEFSFISNIEQSVVDWTEKNLAVKKARSISSEDNVIPITGLVRLSVLMLNHSDDCCL